MKRLLFCALLLGSSLLLSARDYNIMDFGAVSHLQANSTQAIQHAIDRCSADGGGRVVVPAGNYVTGTLVLRSHVHLYLELGATLYGSTDLKDYRRMKSSYQSLRTHTETIQLIYADSVEHVTISGYGTIDGRGRVFPKLSWNDEGITRPHLLRFIQSRDITIKDITLRNSGCWMQHYLACDRLRISGIKVTNRNNYNNDALDLDGCHDVIVSDMLADSDDDGITLKSTSPRRCEDITIQNCIVSSHCNAVKLGTETNGGFRNIHISGITIKPSSDQREKFFGQWLGTSALSLEIVDGGTMENVTVSGLTVTGTESPIFIRLGHRGRGWQFADGTSNQGWVAKDGGAAKPIPIDTVGRMRGLYINNVHARDAGNYGCSITGLAGHPVEDVHLSNISIRHHGGISADSLAAISTALQDEKVADYPEATMWGPLPAKGFYVRHARGVHFDKVETHTALPDARPEFVYEDAE